MYSSDTPQGSWSQRRHRGGYCPYQSTPYMSHFLVDIVPHLYCCRWSEAQCYRFTDLRPTKDCLGYKTPGFGQSPCFMFVCSYLGINCQSTAFFIYFKIYTFDGKVYVIEFRLRAESMFYVCVIAVLMVIQLMFGSRG